MVARILTALVGIPLAVVLVFWGGLPFAAAMGLVSALGALEFYGNVRKLGMRPVEWAGLASVVLLAVIARSYERSTIGSLFPAVLTLLLILSFCVELLRKERSPIANVGSTVFGAIYVGWLISHLVAMRQIDRPIDVCSYHTEVGAVLVMFTFLCTWACDTGAYFLGRAYGKNKLAPKLSPNKTIEGAVGGLVCSVLVAMVVGMVIKLPQQHALALGAICGLLTQLGDLSESAIKRELGIKDFGTLVPGHGGVLDRFDSLLFTGPAVFYYAVIFLSKWPS